MTKKKVYIITTFLLLIIAAIGFYFYQKIFSESVTKNGAIYIKSTDSLTDLQEKIAPFIKSTKDFNWIAKQKNFTKPKGGKYDLKKGMSLNSLLNLLRSGKQTPIKLTFNNQDTVEKLASRIAQQIEADSTDLINAMLDAEFLAKNKLTKQAALQIYIPNSYEFYWNTSAEKFRDKMLQEYHRFWNKERREKAKKLNLSPSEVITLASIVEKETSKKTERPIVAGLYLNRLKNNWPLQADPTIIYCIKQIKGQDFIVKRVLEKDLKIQSPYNTYKKVGLPPTLIAMPDISSIDAVLNPSKHNYFYMCASTVKIGFHEFANSLAEHNRNANKYHNWVTQRGINR